jgi:cell division protein FtsB
MIVRVLSVLLVLSVTVEMCRTAAAISQEGRHVQALQASCQDAANEIAALNQALHVTASPQGLWQAAWRQLGMVSPGDIVFFDGG